MKIESVNRMGSVAALAFIAGAVSLVCVAKDHPLARSTETHQERKTAVDWQGNLQVPSDYRTAYEFLGTWAIADDKSAGSKQLHDVYASPGTIAAFRASGRFPDGTVLVKEVFEAATAPMTTGTVSRAEILKGWFVMIKDGKNSHSGNPLWGDGWGWSWFDANNPTKTTSSNYKTDCQGCHIPARETDWIYISGYPALHN
jgi:Cytochrome P460